MTVEQKISLENLNLWTRQHKNVLNELQWYLPPTKDTIVLALEVERKYIVITDFEKWGYV